MYQIGNEKIPIYKIILLFLVIYFSSNSFVLAVKYEAKSTVLMFLIVVLAVGITLIKGWYHVSQDMLFLMIVMTVNIAMTIIATGYLNAYFLLILIFILAISAVHLYSRQEFYEAYILNMKVIALCSVIVGIIQNVSPGMLNVFKTYGMPNGGAYRDVFLCFQNVGLMRINGIWGEAGMFSVFLIFAMIMECFFVNREVKISNYVIFVVAVALTFSTNGIICLTLLLITILLQKKQSKHMYKVIIITIVLLVIFYVVIKILPDFSDLFTASLSKLDSEDISFAGRMAPILYNLEEGVKSLVWGNGIKGGRFYVDYSFYSGPLYCNTSTTTFLFSSFGIIFCTATVYLTYRFVKSANRVQWVSIMLFIIIMLNINTQAVHLDQIYYLILFSSYMINVQRGK